MKHWQDNDDAAGLWEDGQKLPPEAMKLDPKAVEAGPDYRYVVKPMKRVPPYTRQLKRAILRHRLLFHYYARPIFRRLDNHHTPGRYFFWNHGGGSSVPQNRDAEEVWIFEHDVENELDKLARRISAPSVLHGHRTGETPPCDPAEEWKMISIGWYIHPVGVAVLKQSARDIESLVDLLETLDPDLAGRNVLEAVRSARRVRSGPVIGWKGAPLVSWMYPNELAQLANNLDWIAELERAAAEAGWRHPAVSLVSPGPEAVLTPALDGRWYPARWYFAKTNGGLNPEQLRRASCDRRIKGKKVNGRLQYEIGSVIKAYSQWRPKLEKSE